MSNLFVRISTKAFNLAKTCSFTSNIKSNSQCSVLNSVTRFYGSTASTPYQVVEREDNKLSQEIIKKINDQVAVRQQGRLFAVVHVAGKQFKITEGDVIVIEGYWPPDVGDKISLDKVLLLGAVNFTLIGRPLVERGLVNIYATIIEKTMSHTKTHFRKKRRKQYQRINFYRVQQTMVRINTINIAGELNNPPAVTGLEHAIF